MSGKELDERGYTVVDNIVDDAIIRIANPYYIVKFVAQEDYTMHFEGLELDYVDVVKPFAIRKYADQLAEALLIDLLPKMEGIVGKALVPTYSFVRCYKKGNYLVKHRDRGSCQYSVTFPVVQEKTWTIFMEGNGVDLELGQGIVYKGEEMEHWREPLEEDMQIQIHLHYVEKCPEREQYYWDGREALGIQIKGRGGNRK